MSDWANWKRKHRQDIAHVAGFEERFVDIVLSRIPLIKPDDVVPQFPFVDNKGKNRRIDFMIINPDCGLLLPIELDGRTKRPGQEAGHISQADWDDFLERQNSIIESFGMVLRFSNSRLINNPNSIRAEIQKHLHHQKMNKIADTERFVDRDPVVVSVVPPPSLPQYGRYRALIAGAGLSILLSVGFIVWTENRESAPKQQLPVAVPPLIAAAPIVSATLPLRTSLPDGGAISADSSADQDARLLGLTALDSVGDNQLGPGDLSGKGTLAHRAPPNTDEEGQISASTRKESPPIKEGPLSALDHIPSSQAHAHIGQVKRVCGRLAKWREISSGMFINFDLPYPNDVMSAVIWRKRINEIGQLELIEGQDICVSGLIQTYRGKPQIEVENRDQITP